MPPESLASGGADAGSAAAPAYARPAPLRRWGLLLVKVGALGFVLYFVGRAMARQLAEIPWGQVHFRPGWLVLSLATICLATFVSTISFSLLFVRSGYAPGLGPVCVVAWLSSLGKYVPGKFAAFASTMWLLNRYRVPARVGASVWLLLQVVTTFSGLLLAVPLCFWGPLRGRCPLAWAFVGGGAAICLVILHPRVLGWGVNQLLVRLKRPPVCFLPSPSEYVLPVGCLLVGWGLLGVATWMAVQAILPTPVGTLLVFGPAMSLASVVGVLAIVPGGLGVREAVILAVLTPLTGAYTSVVAVLMRVLVTAAELVMAGAAGLIYRRYRQVEGDGAAVEAS